uniref:Uncharacterized protein n=1 Tax=Arundo donax TaxID=35708 RepID=A0A0A9EMT7_ARUDO
MLESFRLRSDTSIMSAIDTVRTRTSMESTSTRANTITSTCASASFAQS